MNESKLRWVYVFTDEVPPKDYNEWNGEAKERFFVYDEVEGGWLKRINLDEGHEVPCRDAKDENILLEALKEIRDYEGRATSMQRMASAAIQKYAEKSTTCRDGVAQEWNKEKILAHWKDVRTKALSFMLDNPYSVGLYRTSDFFKEIDTHFENMLDLALTTTDGQK